MDPAHPTTPAPSPASPHEGRIAAVGRVASGLYILTVGSGAGATGMLASWVQQASFEPPMLSIALQRGRPLAERIEAGEAFVVNVVPEGGAALLKHFGKGFAPGAPAFEGLATIESAAGVTALSAALATLDCRYAGAIDAGDHRVLLAEVTSGAVWADGGPMVHHRKRGDRY